MGKVEQMGQIRYHQDFSGDAQSKHADELMIANFIEILKNPNLYQLLSSDELDMLRMVIKNHAVLKSHFALEAQRLYLGEEAKSMKI